MPINFFIYSASDRYNLGDLLYPIVSQYFLNEKENKFSYYALTKSDLSIYGAKKTFGYKKLLKDLNNETSKVLFIAGGDGLCCHKEALFSHGSFFDHFFSKIVISSPYFLRIIQKIYWIMRDFFRRSTPPYPFIFQKKNNLILIYNSVSGSRNFSKIDAYKFQENVNFCSVRSKKDFEVFEDFSKITLSPDSITLLSKIYPTPTFHNHLSIPKKFIFFQVSLHVFKEKSNEIIDSINSIYLETRIPFVLCPIGLAYEHEDDIALTEISKKINAEHYLIRKPHIMDIITLLSRSELYIGTSLHGTIISMSFARPYIGIRLVTKVADYLDTWSIKELNGCDQYPDLINKVKAIRCDKTIYQKLEEQKKRLSDLAEKNFFKINDIIKKNDQ